MLRKLICSLPLIVIPSISFAMRVSGGGGTGTSASTTTFSINTFTDANGASVEVCTGVWKSTGSLSFSATYLNGPALTGVVTFSGWASGLQMTNSFQGPTASTASVTCPAVANSVIFTLSASAATGSDTKTLTNNFYNYRFWGTTTVASGYTEANVEGLQNNELSNSRAKTFSLTAGPGEYLIWASPTRLGTVTFTVGGFEGGFMPPETVSITNSAGYTENYYVYRSVNSNLGTVNIVTS